jgi:hypothetical protein
MRILVAYEESGRVRDALSRQGHAAVSCDIQPSRSAGCHIQDDIADVLTMTWDAIIAFPPCTYLTRAAAWRWKDTVGECSAAAAAVIAVWNHPASYVAIENPWGLLNKLWRRPDQVIEPWWFGDAYNKPTCLWTRNLPLLRPTRIVPPAHRVITAMSGKHRSRDRSVTPLGLAEAMAGQWFPRDVVRSGVE